MGSDQGFSAMDEQKRKDLASRGGQESTGSFGDEHGADPSKAGKKGAEHQPKDAKAKGGESSSQS